MQVCTHIYTCACIHTHMCTHICAYTALKVLGNWLNIEEMQNTFKYILMIQEKALIPSGFSRPESQMAVGSDGPNTGAARASQERILKPEIAREWFHHLVLLWQDVGFHVQRLLHDLPKPPASQPQENWPQLLHGVTVHAARLHKSKPEFAKKRQPCAEGAAWETRLSGFAWAHSFVSNFQCQLYTN